MLEDRWLIWKFRRGDKDAFRAIYDKYAGDLLTLAGNLLNDKAGAEDVVQDAFIALAESIETFRLTGSLKGYLERVSRIARATRYVRISVKEPLW